MNEEPGQRGERGAGADFEDDQVEDHVEAVEEVVVLLRQLAQAHYVVDGGGVARLGAQLSLVDSGVQVVRDAQQDRAN